MVTNGPKKFGRISKGFFRRKCMVVLARQPRKVAIITRSLYYQGDHKAEFTVVNIFMKYSIHSKTEFNILAKSAV